MVDLDIKVKLQLKLKDTLFKIDTNNTVWVTLNNKTTIWIGKYCREQHHISIDNTDVDLEERIKFANLLDKLIPECRIMVK